MAQVPVGGGGGGGGLTAAGSGVQPESLTVAVGVWRSETTIVQSGARKPAPWILKLPLRSDRDPAALVDDSAVMKIPRAALVPSTRSSPPLSCALETVRADALAGTSNSATRADGRTNRCIERPFEGVLHIRHRAPCEVHAINGAGRGTLVLRLGAAQQHQPSRGGEAGERRPGKPLVGRQAGPRAGDPEHVAEVRAHARHQPGT